MKTIILALTAAAFTFSAPAANVFRVTINVNMECWDGAGCGEAFTTSEIVSLDEANVGLSENRPIIPL